MTDRYSLRFEKGEREGQRVPLATPRLTVGRRPAPSLVIQDRSVSGAHAALLVAAQGVPGQALGSTNGTRVGSEKITEARLAHGDRLVFGSVAVVFEDRELAGGGGGGAALERVSAESLARSGKRSRVALVVVIVLLLGGGGAAAYYLTGGKSGGGRRVQPVVPVEGNLVSGYSFEGAAGLPEGWSNVEDAPADFEQWGAARATGEAGARSDLDPGEWAQLQSDAVGVPTSRTLTLEASLRGKGGAAGRIGVEFLLDTATPETPLGPVRAWSDWVLEVSRHQAIELVVPIPPGIRRARVVVEARASADEGGEVDVDDVSLVSAQTSASPTAKIGEYGLWVLGDPPQTAALYKVSKLFLSDLVASGVEAARVESLAFEQQDGDFLGRAAGARSISFRVEPEVLGGGLATLGEGGLQEHQVDFERDGVGALLMGEGRDLVLLHLDPPTRVTSRGESGGARITVPVSGGAFRIQVDFSEERTQAGNLAYDARRLEKDGRLGECLASWNELLDRYPFDAKLVDDAREARGRLEQSGLEELKQVEERFERARFFRLVDLYRRCRAQAEAVERKYAGGGEVETQARALIAQVEESLQGLEEDLNRDEVARLQAILKVLEASESPRLSKEVRDYLSEEFGEGN